MARDEGTGDGDGRSWEAFVRAPTVGNSRRLCSATLEGQPAKTDCVDVSPDGRSLLIVATDLIHIVTPQLGLHSSVEPNITVDTNDKDVDAGLLSFIHSSIHVDTATASNVDSTNDDGEGSIMPDYLAAMEKRFIDARWAPVDLGPGHSPLVAVLTTKLEVHLYNAQASAFTGPWKHLGDLRGYEPSAREIFSIAWLPSDGEHQADKGPSTQCILVAATRSGEVCLFRFETNDGILSLPYFERIKLCDEPIRALVSEPRWVHDGGHRMRINIAAATSASVFAASLVRNSIQTQSGLQVERVTEVGEDNVLGLIKWEGPYLLWTTPGQVHMHNRDYDGKKSWSACLRSSREEYGNPLLPATAIRSFVTDGHARFEVTLQDGQHYLVDPSAFDSAPITTSAKLPPHYVDGHRNTLNPLSEAIEGKQLLWACKGDFGGLHFLIHSADEIASFGYPLRTRIRLTLVSSSPWSDNPSAPTSDDVLRELETNFRTFSQVIQAAQPTHFWIRTRAVLASVSSSSSRFEVASGICQILEILSQRPTVAVDLPASIATWLVDSSGLPKARTRPIADRLLGLARAKTLLESIKFATMHLRLTPQLLGGQAVAYCKHIAAAAFVLSGSSFCGPGSAESLVEACASLLGRLELPVSCEDIFRQWKMMTQQDEGIDVGERCPACDAVVRMALVEDELRWARCQAGHVWKRCSVGIALITQSRTRICSTCGSEFKIAADASCGVEESLLEQRTKTCCICRGGRPIMH